jgi:tripartite-type tricarboxylate transporter receptor subunit TctC
MSLLIGTVAGGEYDLHARLIGRFIGKHIPGNPTVVAQNMAGGGGVVMANFLYNVAPKDGTAIAVLNKALPASQAMGDTGLKFDTGKFFWLGTLAPTSETMVLWRTTGVRTLEEARRTEIVIGATGKDNITYMFPKLMAELLGARFKIITGYRGGADINVAMERGEVGGRQNTWTSWKTTKPHWLQAGDITVIAQGGETAKDLPGVPNVEDLARTEEDRSVFRLILAGSRLGRPIVTTPGVPSERAQALRAAFDATMRDTEFLAACKDAKVEVDPVTGARLQEVVAQILATPATAAQRTKHVLQ